MSCATPLQHKLSLHALPGSAQQRRSHPSQTLDCQRQTTGFLSLIQCRDQVRWAQLGCGANTEHPRDHPSR
jgi:hypothetical protein